MEKFDLAVYNKAMCTQNGKDYFIKPFCDFFKIDYDNQIKRIKNDRICQIGTGKKTYKEYFGDDYTHFTVTKRGFVRWIQLINPQIVTDELRDKFNMFQANVFEYLYEGISTKIQYLEDLQKLSQNVSALRRWRGNIGNQIKKINKALSIMEDCSYEQWKEKRLLYIDNNDDLKELENKRQLMNSGNKELTE